MSSIGLPFSLRIPFPFLQYATATAVFLRPKHCTAWIGVAAGALMLAIWAQSLQGDVISFRGSGWRF